MSEEAETQETDVADEDTESEDLLEDPAEESGDALPADLDITELEVVYEFPNNSKRRVAAILYFVVGGICIALGLSVDSPLVNDGLTVAGGGLVLFALYIVLASAATAFDETDALVVAARTVGFAPGHASAQMGWWGWRSRPVWRILLYSHEPEPEQRALVLVDGVTGEVREYLVEDNPEDWSDL